MQIKKLVLASLLTLLGACDGAVKGDIFIVKGNGDIAVSPGRTVHFVPIESESALLVNAGSVAAELALLSIQSSLNELCPITTQKANQALLKLTENVTEIGKRENIPVLGCEALEADSKRLTLAASDVESRNKAERSKLTSAVTSAQSAKNAKISDLAQDLLNRELKKVSATYANPDNSRWSATWSISNNSKYCVSFDSRWIIIEALQKGVTQGNNETWMKRSIQKDEYGFPVGECHLLAGQSIVERNSASPPIVSTPAQKKALADGKLATFSCGGDACIKIDGARIARPRGITFHTVKRLEKGSNITYQTTPVDWKALVSKEKSIRKFEAQIKTSKNALAAFEKKVRENTSLIAASSATSTFLSCKADSETLATLTPTIEKAETLLPLLAGCSSTPGIMTQSIVDLNGVLDLGIEIPDREAPYKSAFKSAVLSTIGGDDTITADTSIQGHYNVDSIKPGDYIAIAEYSDSFVDGFWMDVIKIDRGDQVVDLNHNTFVGVNFNDYLVEAASLCYDLPGMCASKEKGLPSRTTIAEAVEVRQEQLEKFQETIDSIFRTLERFN